jgi:hypothetical protein
MSTHKFREVSPSEIKIVNGVPVLGPREIAPSEWQRRQFRQQMSLTQEFIAHSGIRIEELFRGNLDQIASQYGARLSNAGALVIRVLPANEDGIVNFEFHREYDIPCWRLLESS